MIPKSCKKRLIDYLEIKCNNSGLSKYSLGLLVRIYHCSLPIILIIFVLLGNKIIAQLVLAFFISVVLLWFILDGCILSMLENRLCSDNWNIVDPLLEIFGIPINYESRKNITYIICMYYTITIFGIYAIRYR